MTHNKDCACSACTFMRIYEYAVQKLERYSDGWYELQDYKWHECKSCTAPCGGSSEGGCWFAPIEEEITFTTDKLNEILEIVKTVEPLSDYEHGFIDAYFDGCPTENAEEYTRGFVDGIKLLEEEE